MQIVTHPVGEAMELRLSGRLDASWAEFVGQAIEDVIRGGKHHVRLHLAEVDYISSAGIRVVVKYYRQLNSIRGSLAVTSPSTAAMQTLRMAGLASMLQSAAAPAKPAAAAPAAVQCGRVSLQVLESAPDAKPITLAVHGDPTRIAQGATAPGDSVPLKFDANAWGLGIGAFGRDFADCADRFGEFLAIGGAAATMPADGESTPDFLIATGQLIPAVEALQAIRGSGAFSTLFRFESAARGEVVGICEVLVAAMDRLGTDTIAVAIAAEAGAVVGAALTHSPARLAGRSLMEFPAVRDHMAFTTERGTERSTILAIGVVTRAPAATLAPHVRALGFGTDLQAHVHALAFPYRPLPTGSIQLHETVASLLEGSLAQSLLHLMADDRPYEGVGQTELFRGACWCAPVGVVEALRP